MTGTDDARAVSPTGHRWPCVGFYVTSTEYDRTERCTCPEVTGPDLAEATGYRDTVCGHLFHECRCGSRAETTTPTVTLAARRGGQTQTLIESLLTQAEDRGLTVEVVYPETTTEAIARRIVATSEMTGRDALELVKAVQAWAEVDR